MIDLKGFLSNWIITSVVPPVSSLAGGSGGHEQLISTLYALSRFSCWFEKATIFICAAAWNGAETKTNGFPMAAKIKI